MISADLKVVGLLAITVFAVLILAAGNVLLGSAFGNITLNDFGLGIFASEGAGASGANADEVDKSSTPKSEWQKGVVPYLYQTDPKWSSKSYGGGTIETHGCGPTAIAMAYISLTGKKNLNPVKIAKFSENNGYLEQGITSWLLISEGIENLGLSAEELPSSPSQIERALMAGKPVICSVSKGDFTTDGHFILLCGMTDDGKVEIRDPNSYEKSHTTWKMGRILKQCRNIWAISRA